MASTHALASGMGGMRTAGDLVARMQMTRGLRLPQAKQYVADRLGCSVLDLSDTIAMHDLRRDLGLGRIQVQDLTYPDQPGRDRGQVPHRRDAGHPDQLGGVLQAQRRARPSG